MTIKFVNGQTQTYENALETEEYFNGNSRRTLTFQILPQNCNLQTLSDLCTEENCASIELTNEELGVSNIHEGYVLKLKVGIESILSDAETNQYTDMVVLKLGKRTFIEQKLHELGVM